MALHLHNPWNPSLYPTKTSQRNLPKKIRGLWLHGGARSLRHEVEYCGLGFLSEERGPTWANHHVTWICLLGDVFYFFTMVNHDFAPPFGRINVWCLAFFSSILCKSLCHHLLGISPIGAGFKHILLAKPCVFVEMTHFDEHRAAQPAKGWWFLCKRISPQNKVPERFMLRKT